LSHFDPEHLMKKLIATLSFALAMTACGQQAEDSGADSAAVQPVTTVDVAIYADAVANSNRPDADRERDAGRKPAEVLEFLGISPGMVVLDMFSGGGYYTEIMSSVVTDQGKIIAHSNTPYLSFAGDEFVIRYANNRLANVDVLMAENNELELDAEQFDAITMVLSYHDIYFEDLDRGWAMIDGPKFLAELRKSLKPDGFVGIVDHSAEAGAPAETGGTIHRIDEAIVIADMQAAGFELEARSDVLHNPDDDVSKLVFAPEIRGKTNRFVLRFRKAH